MRNHVNLEAPNPMKMFPSCLLHGNIAFSAWPSCCSFNGRTYRPISMAKFKYEWHEVEGSGPFQVQSSPAPKTTLGHNEMHSHIRNLLLYCPPHTSSLWGIPPPPPSFHGQLCSPSNSYLPLPECHQASLPSALFACTGLFIANRALNLTLEMDIAQCVSARASEPGHP